MEHDPATRPKRPRDPIRAAFEVFLEVIGEKPRTLPKAKPAKSKESASGQKRDRD